MTPEPEKTNIEGFRQFDPQMMADRERHFMNDLTDKSYPAAFNSGVVWWMRMFNLDDAQGMQIYGFINYSSDFLRPVSMAYLTEAFKTLNQVTGLGFDPSIAAEKWFNLREANNQPGIIHPIDEESEFFGEIYSVDPIRLKESVELRGQAFEEVYNKRKVDMYDWNQFETKLVVFYQSLHKIINNY